MSRHTHTHTLLMTLSHLLALFVDTGSSLRLSGTPPQAPFLLGTGHRVVLVQRSRVWFDFVILALASNEDVVVTLYYLQLTGI